LEKKATSLSYLVRSSDKVLAGNDFLVATTFKSWRV